MTEENRKKAILVTGVAGVGKTMLAKHLQDLGHEAYSIEDEKGMFEVHRKGTKEVFDGYDVTNPEHIENSDWICHVDVLKEFLAKQKTDVAFYFGVAANLDEIIPFFDKVILLKASSEKLQERLMNRDGMAQEIGSTAETRKMVFEWKDWWENEMEKKGVIVVNADGIPDDVAKKIIGA